MAAAIERHDGLIREIVEHQGGFVFKTVGDAFCVAFATVPEAAVAALAIQDAVAAEPWPDGASLRVRVALHTGACQERDDDYFGPTVNRAARLVAAAHGGQILASGATAELLGDFADAGVHLQDLGMHRLRDLGRPEHVFQLSEVSQLTDFPPLRSLDNPDLPNNLPTLLSDFIGREHELTEIRTLVRDSRLVTLTGAGGSGKTRIAMQFAAELLDGTGDGVWLVELAQVLDEDQVAAAVVSAVGLPEAISATPQDALIRALALQSALLILDNCEHLVNRVAALTEAVLMGCPGVRVIATSREPLGVDGEHVYRVPSMSLPDEDIESLEEAQGSDAVALFIGRALDAGVAVPDNEAGLVVSVCRRLDGIPLALELAAARLSSMSLHQLSDRLDQRFRLLTGGSRNAVARQQTLQALVDWSYSLLNPSEQSVLRRLSVFVGGFELEGAEYVCQSDDVDEYDVLNLLHSLVEKSLVVADQDAGSMRYRLLETIRQFGAQELLRASGDAGVTEVRDLHADYLLACAKLAATELAGPNQSRWLTRLDLEGDNVRAALGHLGSDPSRARDVLVIVSSLERYYRSRGQVDSIPYVLAALDVVDGEADEIVVAGLLSAASLLGWLYRRDRDQVNRASELAADAREMASALGLRRLEARSTSLLALTKAFNLHDGEARLLAEQALALAQGIDDHSRAEIVLWSIGYRMADVRGIGTDEERGSIEEVRAIAERHGDVTMVALADAQLARIAQSQDDLVSARGYYEAAIPRLEELGAFEMLTVPWNNLVLVLLEFGEFEQAVPMLRRNLRFARRSELRNEYGDLVFSAGCIAASRNRWESAARLIGAGRQLAVGGYAQGTIYTTPQEDRLEERCLEQCREGLGTDGLARELARGRLLSGSDACELAFATTTVRA